MLQPFKSGVHILGVIRVSNLGKLFFAQKYFEHMSIASSVTGFPAGINSSSVRKLTGSPIFTCMSEIGENFTLLGGVDKRFQNL